MDLISFYQGILETLGTVIDEKNSQVYYDSAIGLDPILIKNKALVLPTKQVLRDPDWNRYVAFHPLSENIARKDSPVFKKLQEMVLTAINSNVNLLMKSMVELCADTDQHKTLNPSQSQILSLFPDADEQSVKNWEKIYGKVSSKYALVKVATLRDKKTHTDKTANYPRVTFTHFPFVEDCEKYLVGKHNNYIVFDTKLRKKDVFGFINLFNFIFSEYSRQQYEYDNGSRSNIAPSFHSLMVTTNRLFKEINRVSKLLKWDVTSLDWGEPLKDLTCYRNLIPVLAENDGEVTEGDRRRHEAGIVAPNQVQQAGSNVKRVIPQPLVNPTGYQPQPVVPQFKVTPLNQNRPANPVVPPTPAPKPVVAPAPVAQPQPRQPVNVIPQTPVVQPSPTPTQGQVPVPQPTWLYDAYGNPVQVAAPASYLQPAVQPIVPQGNPWLQPAGTMMPAPGYYQPVKPRGANTLANILQPAQPMNNGWNTGWSGMQVQQTYWR